jgi:hypothetical protein
MKNNKILIILIVFNFIIINNQLTNHNLSLINVDTSNNIKIFLLPVNNIIMEYKKNSIFCQVLTKILLLDISIFFIYILLNLIKKIMVNINF